ncbi:MAG: CopG family transcriptional regulator [Rhizobiales bacterium]|nr:CopG family transcriptional regulator [Hyphomicrobiales bacterium]
MIRTALLAMFFSLISAGGADAAERPLATLFKNPQCSCCEQYAKYLRRNGFEVKVVATHDLSLIKEQHGVSGKFEGCHTTLIGNYVVEGHVPVKTIDKLLTERPDIRGISLPGMPQGSPGMTGQKAEPFTIYEIGSDADSSVYAVE